MRHPFEHLALRRADKLIGRIAPHLPRDGSILDVGSGAGHNGAALEATGRYRVYAVDVHDFHVAGDRPLRFDGERLPFRDGSFSMVTAMFVLQYAADPERLLGEMRRVCRGPLIVLQSTYRGAAALAHLKVRERVMGKWAFEAARWSGYVDAQRTALEPRRFLTREDVAQAAAAGGLGVRTIETEPGASQRLSRDLFVLERR